MDKASLAQWLERLETLHPNPMDLGLERVSAVAQALQLLPVAAPVVTVAGTNGKGSTVAVLEAIVTEIGLLAGVFTSPHLLRFNERIRVGAQEATDDEIISAFEAIDSARGEISLTYFEFAALAALLVFRSRGVQVLILEVGLGGRLDAVNMVDPTVAVITSIDLDHQAWLGGTRGSIAREKAGILRAGRAVVIADPSPPPELLQCAAEAGAAPVLCLGRDFTAQPRGNLWRGSLRTARGGQRALPEQTAGALLPANICAALQAALLLGQDFSDAQLGSALAAARPRGRRESQGIAGLEYVFDVAHNPAAINKLVEYLDVTYCKGRNIALFSVMSDKDIHGMIKAASGCFDAWFVAEQPANPRAAVAADVAAILAEHRQPAITISASPGQALERARAAMDSGDRLVVFGSFHTVGEVLRLLDSQRQQTGLPPTSAQQAPVSGAGPGK
jgi:dihydrofolate synthase / folylpolyglutamate synthase